MTNGSVDFILGKLEAKLDLNELAHAEIRETLLNIATKSETTNKIIMDIAVELGTLKGKASLWGGVVGFLVSLVTGAISWFVMHLQR